MATASERPSSACLQAPLQPLQDNLESQTYETFERDPVKYKQYQEATRQALVDLHPIGAPEPVVMVVGAGRGPLVAAALAAARQVGRRIKVYALDKNVNAVITLQNRCRNEPEWAECVTVISSDMREWQLHEKEPVKADILISEVRRWLHDCYVTVTRQQADILISEVTTPRRLR